MMLEHHCVNINARSLHVRGIKVDTGVLCPLGITLSCAGKLSMFFLSSADFIFKIYFFKIFKEYHQSDPDQAQHVDGPDLGTNCL